MWRQNWCQYLWTSLCQFNFFVNLLHSLGVSFFEIWHLFDNLTSFWYFDTFNLNHLSPHRAIFAVPLLPSQPFCCPTLFPLDHPTFVPLYPSPSHHCILLLLNPFILSFSHPFALGPTSPCDLCLPTLMPSWPAALSPFLPSCPCTFPPLCHFLFSPSCLVPLCPSDLAPWRRLKGHKSGRVKVQGMRVGGCKGSLN